MFLRNNQKNAASSSAAAIRPESARGAAAPSLLAARLHVVGNLHNEGDLQIDGRVEGDIHSDSLTVGKDAHVTGAIFGDRVRIAGSVAGEITAKVIELMETARVIGDITHDTLVVKSGAYFKGNSKRREPEEKQPKANTPRHTAGKDGNGKGDQKTTATENTAG